MGNQIDINNKQTMEIKGKEIKLFKLLKLSDIRYNFKCNINDPSFVRGGIALLNPELNKCFSIGSFYSSEILEINNVDMTFTTIYGIYKIEIIENAKFNADQKPYPNCIYEHYKGGIYKVLFLAKHTENDEIEVVYQSLHFGSYHVRPLTVWNDPIIVDGEKYARFLKVD